MTNKIQKPSTICVGHHLTQDEDKLSKKHSTICVGHHLTQDEDKLNKKHSIIQKPSTICVEHHHTQDTRRSFHLPSTSVHSPFYWGWFVLHNFLFTV